MNDEVVATVKIPHGMSIKAATVEDSRLARNELKELLKKHQEIELIGEAENVDLGINLSKKVILIYFFRHQYAREGWF